MKKSFFVSAIFAVISLTLSAFPVEVKSDLTKEEESELSLDESVSKAESKRFDLLTEKITLLLKANQIDDAEAVFKKVSAAFYEQDNWTASRVEKAGYSIACAYIGAKDFEKASKFTDELLKMTKDDAIVFYIKALAVEGLGKADEAAKWKEKAVTLDAEDEEYRFEIGQFFFEQKLYPIAEAEFGKLIQLTTGDRAKSEFYVNAQLFLARIAFDKRDYQDAIKKYGEVASLLKQQNLLEDLPGIQLEIVSAHINAARDFEIQGDYAKELETIQAAEQLLGKVSPGLINASAAALSRLKRYDEALKKYEDLMKLAPEVPDFLTGYGDVLMNLGKKDEADAQFKKAIELYKKGIEKEVADKEDTATNLNNLAWFYATHKRDIEEGIKLSKRSLELRPDEAAYMDTIAELYFLSGQKDEAIKYIKQAIEKNPTHLLYYQQQLDKFEGKTPKKEEPK